MVAMKSRGGAFMAEPKPEGLAANRKRGNRMFLSAQRVGTTFFLPILALTLCSPIDGMATIIIINLYYMEMLDHANLLCWAPFSTYHLMPREKSI